MDNAQHDLKTPDNLPRRTSAMAKIVTNISWLVGAFTQSFPAVADFSGHAPPYFPRVGVLVSVLGLCVFAWSYFRARKSRRLLGRGLAYVVTSILLLAIYGVFLEYCTVRPPPHREGYSRRQIGFYMVNWSLTDQAKRDREKLLSQDPPIEINTPNDFMKIYGVWGGEGRTDEIWTLWSIILAGSLMLVLFLAAFISWAYGIALVARYFNGK
jgi:hypothetical protein